MLRQANLLYLLTGAALSALYASAASAAPDREVPQACKAITQEDLGKVGTQSVADALKALPTSSAPGSCPQPAPMTPFARDMLAGHNAARAAVGAPPLRWNPQFEADATDRARQNAQAGTLVHASREGRGTVRENILRAPAGYSTAQMMDRWTRERAQFVPGIFPNVCNTGDDCSGILHYSQIIWPETTDVGCGMWPSGADVWVVCRLDPGGNKDGKPVGLPLKIAENETIRPRLVGGDYGKVPVDPVPKPSRNSAWYVGGDFGSMIVEDIDFDYGLEPTIPSSQTVISPALSFMINGMLDFGDDDSISGFVGGGAGVARVDYNNVRAYSNSEAVIDESDTEFARQLLQLGCSPASNYCDTNVVAPTMPGTEVFKPSQVASATSTKQQPSITPPCNSSVSFWSAREMYEAAKKAGDAGGMENAKGLMQAAIGRQWQAMEDSTEAGEMVSVSTYSLGDFLGKMMDSYKDLTGQLPPGYYESPNGYTTDIVPPDPAAPTLPASEVFNPATAPQCPLDVM